MRLLVLSCDGIGLEIAAAYPPMQRLALACTYCAFTDGDISLDLSLRRIPRTSFSAMSWVRAEIGPVRGYEVARRG